MGRKPYLRTRLTNDEFKAVNKIAHWTRVDETWFYLNDKSDDETAVWDMEKNYWITLQYGLKLLMESFDRDEDELLKLKVLNKKEFKTFKNLLERIK